MSDEPTKRAAADLLPGDHIDAYKGYTAKVESVNAALGMIDVRYVWDTDGKIYCAMFAPDEPIRLVAA